MKMKLGKRGQIALLGFVKACLDDSHGISEEAYNALIDLRDAIQSNPAVHVSNILQTLTERTNGNSGINGRFYPLE